MSEVKEDGLHLKGDEAEKYKAYLAAREKSPEKISMEQEVARQLAAMEAGKQKDKPDFNPKAVFEKSEHIPFGLKAKAFQKQMKGLYGKNIDQYKEGVHDMNMLLRSGEAMDEGTNSEGGYATSPVFFQDIVQKSMDESAIADVDLIPISTNTIYSTEFLTGVSVTDSTELGTPTSTIPTLDQFNITAKDTRASTVIGKNLLDDAPQMLAFVQKSYQEALKTKFNQIIFTDATASSKNFNGILAETVSGTGPYGETTTGGAKVFRCGVGTANIDNAYLNHVVHGVSPEDWPNCKWYFNDGLSENLENLTNLQGNPLLYEPNGGPPMMMKTFPIRRVTDITAPSALAAGGMFGAFGDLKSTAHMWMRQNAEFVAITEGTVNGVNCGEQRALGLVMFLRYAFKVYVRRFNDGRRTGLIVMGINA